MSTLRIVFECEDTPNNRRLAVRLFDNVIGRRGELPVTRSLEDPWEMGKVIDCIDVTTMSVDPPTANPTDAPTPAPNRVPVGEWVATACGCVFRESRPAGFTIDPAQPRACGRHNADHIASLFPSPQNMAMVAVTYHDTQEDAINAPRPQASEDAVGFAAELQTDRRIRPFLSARGYIHGQPVVVGRDTPGTWAYFRVWRDPAAPGGWTGEPTGRAAV